MTRCGAKNEWRQAAARIPLGVSKARPPTLAIQQRTAGSRRVAAGESLAAPKEAPFRDKGLSNARVISGIDFQPVSGNSTGWKRWKPILRRKTVRYFASDAYSTKASGSRVAACSQRGRWISATLRLMRQSVCRVALCRLRFWLGVSADSQR